MLEPDFYPHAPQSVELRETHISWVFLAGNLAYKVKKPLVLPFLDYGTVERRREMCHEEVRLNRRLAPRIYLRVVGVAGGENYRLTAEDDAQAVEYAVEMRRVDEHRSLAELAHSGGLEPAHIDAVAALLARFHAEASVVPPTPAYMDALAATLDENLATLRQAAEEAIDQTRLEAAGHFTRAYLAARGERLEARADAGLVRDCHGDLRAEHVIVPEQGEIYIYDCIEFEPDLRRIDVANDIAFLVMDLARLGAETPSLRLIDAYRRGGGDAGDEDLLPFFASYRAWVRAKIACVRAQELEGQAPERERLWTEARDLISLGHRFAWRARRPLVLVVCGVSGTGKTTLARVVAGLSGWAHVSSDVVRKRLAGLSVTERGGEELYSPERTIATYRELGTVAAEHARRGDGVIIDATFHLREERDAFRATLGHSTAPLLFVHCQAPTDALLARVAARERHQDRVSDAGVAVLERQLAEFEALNDVPDRSRAELISDAPPAEVAARLEAIIDARLWTSS